MSLQPQVDFPAAWYIAECVDQACQYRFPVEGSQCAGLHCPRCRNQLTFTPVATAGQYKPAPVRTRNSRLYGLLDNIRSIHNVGSMFRSADGAGLEHLYLCGITATPEHPRLVKAALGAQESVAWSFHPNAVVLADQLLSEGYELWGLERGITGEDITASPQPSNPEAKAVLVVGNEKAGVDPELLARCARVFALPMAGQKSSLNAAVAFGIAVYALSYSWVNRLDTPPDST